MNEDNELFVLELPFDGIEINSNLEMTCACARLCIRKYPAKRIPNKQKNTKTDKKPVCRIFFSRRVPYTSSAPTTTTIRISEMNISSVSQSLLCCC